VDPLIASFAEALERSIVAQPANWLWSHRRWRGEKPIYV
jgi:lauroyl/myristoyl acyltransferase